MLSVKTGQKRRLTRTDTVDSQPALSSDGRFLAFVRARGFGVSDIYVLEMSHRLEPIGEPRELTSGGGLIQGPAWVGNGSELLFVSGQTSGRRTLQRLDIHGMNRPRAVPVLSDNVVTPAVALAAGSLAYSRERADRNIWSVKVAAAGIADAQPQIVIASTYLEKQPQFSPDGRQIAFASSRSGAEEIWISDARGQNARPLTQFNGVAVGSPRWSPDGTRIAFDGFPAGSGEIYVVPSQGGAAIRVTNDTYPDASPSWSGDGQSIYFVSTRGPDTEVWKIRSDLPNAEPTPVTTTGATFAPVEAADGYVYYLKRGGVWRVPSRGGDERSLTDSVHNVRGYAHAPGGLLLLRGAAPQGSRVEYLAFASGRVTRVFSTRRPIAHIAVSRSGDSLLYTQVDEEAADLMLIQHFR